MRVVDSHTEGEPTRLVIDGGPPLGGGSLAAQRQRFASDFDHIRRFVVAEPRGSEALVGALLCEPEDSACTAGLIFFNTAGYLGMCGHGTIGAAVTLAHRGVVDNVESYRHAKDVHIEVAGRMVTGDVAWGGNWFFLTEDAPCPVA